MKVKKILRNPVRPEADKKKQGDPIRSFVLLIACAFLAVLIAVGSKILGAGDRNQVYAASDSDISSYPYSHEYGQAESSLPSGIAGVVSGVCETSGSDATVKRMGTSCQEVVVGQRVKKVSNTATEFNVSSSMEDKVNDFGTTAISMAQSAKLMSDSDYDTLLRIVEAEAGEEDVKGRVLVANVIMNRVNNEGFPDNVTDVVWQYVNGVPQFSPTYDGRIYEVTVTEETREAVKQALEGVDYSQGALFFIQKSAAEKHNVTWFEKDLKRLFKYGVHEFYTYPDEVQFEQAEAVNMDNTSELIITDTPSDENGAQDNVVQIAKNDILE